ncbi:MAG: response regulator [Gammaproteobacteria bacterium]|nr:response regulator [Gammaproteobacteria bacterium]
MTGVSNNNPARILVADDMATNRELIKQVLRGDEYIIVEAVDGVDAVEKISSQKFDVILLDIMMPNLDGFGVVQQVRADEQYDLLPIILLTALGSADDIAQGMELGATDYVTKPFNAVELKARINAAVGHKRLTDRLDDTESVLFSLARMVEARDADTGDHCDRLAHMAVVFGQELGLGYEELEALRRGGVLHDIGKLGIPDSILLKKGKLTEDEWVIMKQHTIIGASLCAPLRTMKQTVDIIRCHHERWDGSGYPIGLEGENIPLLARVFQVVDVYDALSNERPYKPAFPAEKVKQILLEETSKGFWDPDIVAKFIEIIIERPEKLVRSEEQKDRSARILDEIMDSGVMDWYKVGETA